MPASGASQKHPGGAIRLRKNEQEIKSESIEHMMDCVCSAVVVFFF